MKLKLKEDPQEWRKFALIAILLLALLSGILWRRLLINDCTLQALLAALAALLLLALARPAVFRPVYRAAMRFSHAMGQIVGRVLLFFCFIIVLTPIALLLRLMGHDLLQLRPRKTTSSYWKPARSGSHHDRAF